MPNFNLDHKQVLDDLLLGHPFVRAGKMFGYPAYYAGKKVCICLFENGVSVKLPEQAVARLLAGDQNAHPFEPMAGRKMREWVLVELSRAEEYRQYRSIFDKSIRFVLSQQEQP